MINFVKRAIGKDISVDLPVEGQGTPALKRLERHPNFQKPPTLQDHSPESKLPRADEISSEQKKTSLALIQAFARTRDPEGMVRALEKDVMAIAMRAEAPLRAAGLELHARGKAMGLDLQSPPAEDVMEPRATRELRARYAEVTDGHMAALRLCGLVDPKLSYNSVKQVAARVAVIDTALRPDARYEDLTPAMQRLRDIAHMPAATAQAEQAVESHKQAVSALLPQTADYRSEMDLARAQAAVSGTKPVTSVAIAMQSMDSAIFDAEMKTATRDERTTLAAYRAILRKEGDPISERAMAQRHEMLSQNLVKDGEARGAMMQVLAHAEQSLSAEQREVDKAAQQLRSDATGLDGRVDDKRLAATMTSQLRQTFDRLSQDPDIRLHREDRVYASSAFRKAEVLGGALPPKQIEHLSDVMLTAGSCSDDAARVQLKAMRSVAGGITPQKQKRSMAEMLH